MSLSRQHRAAPKAKKATEKAPTNQGRGFIIWRWTQSGTNGSLVKPLVNREIIQQSRDKFDNIRDEVVVVLPCLHGPLRAAIFQNIDINMTVKPNVSLTDQGYDFAKSLVKNGKFASVSAVMQYGLRLVEREDEEYNTHLEAFRNDLKDRASEPFCQTKT